MQTVISALEPRQTAHAVHLLMAAGFSRQDVHIQRAGDLFGPDDDLDDDMHEPHAQPERRGLLSSLGHFVTSLFGIDTPAGVAYTYTEALQRGGSVLLVDVADPAQCERAIGILRNAGAMAIRVIERSPDQPLRALAQQASA